MNYKQIATVLSVLCLGLTQVETQAAVVNNGADQNQPKAVKKPSNAKHYVVQLGAFMVLQLKLIGVENAIILPE